MKHLLYFSIICSIMLSFVSSSCSSETNSKIELTQEQKDSIQKAIKDSIRISDSISLERKKEKEATIAKLSKNFRISKDEFSDYSWIYHKSTPEYTNINSIHLYFKKDSDGSVSNLRFRIQYEGESWLFVENIIFNIDGENVTFIPGEMERDCGNGGRIWEWCDESASLNTSLIKEIANAKKVKMKLNGSQYYDTRTISDKQLKGIKETLEYYEALGGSLN